MLFSDSQPQIARHRVVITGAGLVTALGFEWKANAAGFRTGRTAFRTVDLFDVSRQRVKTAAQVELPRNLPAGRLSKRRVARLDRAAKLLLFAALEAWRQCGWTGGASLPVVLGTTSGGMSLGEAYFRDATQRPSQHRWQAARITHYQAQQQGLDIADALGFTGPITIVANACASGANALGHAFHLVRSGVAERVFTGGYDALSHLVFAGFDALQALSPTVCRPFDAGRDGLALGEGAAAFAFETLDSARSRGANILGEMVGYGASTDVHHLTQPSPNGEAALMAMCQACRVAGIEPGQVGYVNAHGTGTLLNDSAEAEALHRWARSDSTSIPVSSSKASVGHLLGGAGAVEAAICLMALQEQWLPPTSTLRQVDSGVRFPVVRQSTDAHLEFALSNSFGFGGANASLILRRWS